MPFSPLVSELRRRLGTENVLSAPSELTVYDCDALTIARNPPDVVVFPRSTGHVVATVQACREHDTPLIARGAGTGLAGGCTAHRGGVVLSLARMNRVLEVDLRNRMAVVEPGVANLQLAQALAGTGYHFAPDPSSQGASTIGGNVATNAGGPHTLLYGVTVNHLLGLEAVLSSGDVVTLGTGAEIAALDLAGLLCGSEGTLAIVTKVWIRLTPNPQDYRTLRVVFNSVEDAANSVTQIIAAGIIPAAMELMDQGILGAVEEAFHVGFPPETAALLVIELDGPLAPASGLDQKQQQIIDICRRNQAGEIIEAATPAERELLWKCRKLAVGAVGRLSPSYLIEDGVVPRTQLPRVFRRIAEIGRTPPNPHRQRRPCRRRQRASDPAFRRARPRPGRAGQGRRPRGAFGVHRLRRQHHGRARRGHREARPDGQPFRAGRPSGPAAGPRGAGSFRAAQSGQGSAGGGRILMNLRRERQQPGFRVPLLACPAVRRVGTAGRASSGTQRRSTTAGPST